MQNDAIIDYLLINKAIMNKNEDTKQIHFNIKLFKIQSLLTIKMPFLSSISNQGANNPVYLEENTYLKSLIDNKWNSFAKKKYFENLLTYSIYMLIFLINSIYIMPTEIENYFENQQKMTYLSWISIALAILQLFYCSYYARIEVK